MCVSLVLSPVCNTSSKADSGVASYLKNINIDGVFVVGRRIKAGRGHK